MKIEKINENQIRCTLTREDLELHQIRLSELAYGSEKAKKLFRDMMEQAQLEFMWSKNIFRQKSAWI
jgi:adapter protein MecA 1/2